MLDKVLRDLRKRLKKNANILGKERKYRNAAVLIPIVEINHEAHVLYQVRSAHIRQGGEIGFPGGMVEEADQGNYERTALRETVEELGVDDRSIETIGYLGTYVAHSDVTIDVYVGVLTIKSIEGLKLSEEVASVFTVPLSELMVMKPEIHYINMRIQQSFVDEKGDEIVLLDAKSLGLPEKYEKPYFRRKRKVYFYRYGDKTIWGMTGEMTFEFLEILKNSNFTADELRL